MKNTIQNKDHDSDKWLKLKEIGNECFKQGLNTEAMMLYTKAIAINNKQSVLYSNRALVQLKLKKYEEAREDAEHAIELDEKNVKYFRLLSEALQKLDSIDEALDACHKGLELNSKDEVLLIRLRDLNAIVSRKVTEKSPCDLKERLEKLYVDPEHLKVEMEKYFNKKPKPIDIKQLSENEFFEFLKSTKKLMEAHCYYHGTSGKPVNLKKAFEIFKNNLSDNCAEALFNLGSFYAYGKGVCEINYSRMWELYKKAASQKPYFQLPDGRVTSNIGVAEAECEMGDAYRDGRGVDIENEKAAKHYLRSAELECPNALNNLGVFFYNGTGVSFNLALAREWFKRAAEQGICEAQINYAKMLEQGEGGPVNEIEAIEYYRKAANQGSADALAFLQHMTTQSFIKKTEDKNNLKIFDGTKMKTKNNASPAILERLNQFLHRSKPFPCSRILDNFSYMPNLIEYAENGSITALNEINGLNRIFEAVDCIKNNKNKEAMAYLRESFYLRNSRFLYMGPTEELIEALDKMDPNNEDAMFVRSNLFHNDIKGRIAYLQRCVKQYPNTAVFHYMLSCIYGFDKRHDDSLSEVNRALELKYEPDWLYGKGTALRLCSKKKGYPQYVIDTYQKFINASAPDHRKISNAYYCIASMYVVNADVKNIRLNYNKGKCAEDNLLPCFEREDDFPPKQSVEVYLLASSDTSSCGNCGKDKPKYKCQCLKQAYCDKNCQTSSWSLHREICKTKHKK